MFLFKEKLSMVDNQGSRANKSGKWLENEVETNLCSYGIPSVNYKKGYQDVNMLFGIGEKGILFKHVPFTNLFNSPSRGEFLLQLCDRGPIRIECRNQIVRGSVDEKILYLVENCRKYSEKDIILILEGDGMRKNAKEWAKDKVKTIEHKNIKVMTLNQFKSWTKEVLGE